MKLKYFPHLAGSLVIAGAGVSFIAKTVGLI